MILTDYYKFQKRDLKKTGRMDCTANTGTYPDFENTRKRKDGRGDFKIYVGNNYNMKDPKRDPGLIVTLDSRRLSGIFTPDVTEHFAYGDVRGTQDAIIFILQDFKMIDGKVAPGSILEVFIARGQSKNRIALYQALVDGDLDNEIDQLRGEAEAE